MTVAELIEELKRFPADTEVYTSDVSYGLEPVGYVEYEKQNEYFLHKKVEITYLVIR